MMKTKLPIVITGIVFSISFSWGLQKAVHAGSLPAEIDAYYQSCNFIHSFSTPLERSALAQRKETPPANGPDGGIPERLEKIRETMALARDRMWHPKPGTRHTMRKGKDGSSQTEAHLLKVVSFTAAEDTFIARVHLYPLSHASNLALIALFEKRTGDAPAPPDPEQFAGTRDRAPKTELHFWFKINGRWFLNESKIGLLK